MDLFYSLLFIVSNLNFFPVFWLSPISNFSTILSTQRFFLFDDFVDSRLLCLLQIFIWVLLMSLFDFRFREVGSFLLSFIVPSVSIIITTVNNNIYNYSYKYKKKHKLLNQILKWKTKKKKHFRPNTSIDLLRDILLLLFAWNNRMKKKKK